MKFEVQFPEFGIGIAPNLKCEPRSEDLGEDHEQAYERAAQVSDRIRFQWLLRFDTEGPHNEDDEHGWS